MATFLITAPDGKKYKVSGENAEGAHDALMKMLGEQPPATQADGLEVGVLQDVAQAAGSGAVRGAIGTAELPEMLARGVLRGGQEALQYFGYDVGEDIPVLQTATGQALRDLTTLDDYEAQTRAGKFAGTAAEFVGGGGALGAAGKLAKVGAKATGLEKAQKAAQAVEAAGLSKQALGTAAIAGLGSEAAGQAAEGTRAEGAARFIGALASPAAASRFINMPARGIDAFIKPKQLAKKIDTGNTTVDTVVAQSIRKPSVENLRTAKNTAYKVADDAGISFSSEQMQGVAENARNTLLTGGAGMTKFNPNIDTHISEALTRIDDAATKTSLRELDDLRSEIYDIYRVGQGGGKRAYDSRMRVVIDEIDDLIETNLQGSRLLETAKLANKRYKKTELLRDAMDNAEISAKTTSSGDIVAGYKRAIGNILKSKKQSKFFDDGELDAMRAILDGTVSDDVLKKLGTFSPNTNGLMRAITGVAAFIEPTSLVVGATGLVSKFASDVGVRMQLSDLDRLLATGQTPARFRPTRVAPVLGATQELRQEQ
jgi:hypothetical protein